MRTLISDLEEVVEALEKTLPEKKGYGKKDARKKSSKKVRRREDKSSCQGESLDVGEAFEFLEYKTLNDAAENTGIDALKKGSTEIWYMKPSMFIDLNMGSEHAEEKGILPDPKNLGKTHELLGEIQSKKIGEIFYIMQGEMWSPNGEARTLIKRKGISHTSMSVGDVMVLGNRTLMVDGVGWYDLDKKKVVHESMDEARLTPEQAKEIESELVNNGVPVRFLINGQAVDILSGKAVSKGSNIMYHPVYWSFTKETAKKVADWLGAKAVFSEGKEDSGKPIGEADAYNDGMYILEQILSYKSVRSIGKNSDPQTGELAIQTYREIAKLIGNALANGGMEALSRLSMKSNFQKDDSGVTRNNVFKAANALGLKLPSYSF